MEKNPVDIITAAKVNKQHLADISSLPESDKNEQRRLRILERIYSINLSSFEKYLKPIDVHQINKFLLLGWYLIIGGFFISIIKYTNTQISETGIVISMFALLVLLATIDMKLPGRKLIHSFALRRRHKILKERFKEVSYLEEPDGFIWQIAHDMEHFDILTREERVEIVLSSRAGKITNPALFFKALKGIKEAYIGQLRQKEYELTISASLNIMPKTTIKYNDLGSSK